MHHKVNSEEGFKRKHAISTLYLSPRNLFYKNMRGRVPSSSHHRLQSQSIVRLPMPVSPL